MDKQQVTDAMVEAAILHANGHDAPKESRTFYRLVIEGALSAQAAPGPQPTRWQCWLKLRPEDDWRDSCCIVYSDEPEFTAWQEKCAKEPLLCKMTLAAIPLSQRPAEPVDSLVLADQASMLRSYANESMRVDRPQLWHDLRIVADNLERLATHHQSQRPAEPEEWAKMRALGWQIQNCRVCGTNASAMTQRPAEPTATWVAEKGPAFNVSSVGESTKYGGTTYTLKAHFHNRAHAETVKSLLEGQALPPGPFPRQFADQAEVIDIKKLEAALVWYGCACPSGEMLSWWVGREVNRLLERVLEAKRCAAPPQSQQAALPDSDQGAPVGWRRAEDFDRAMAGKMRYRKALYAVLGGDAIKVRAALAEADGEAALPEASPAGPFQWRVQPWMMACFGPAISADAMERNHRFIEESLELVQACGCTASEAHQLVDYVYGRPVGEKQQEAGGVMVTLAALCLAQGLDMHEAGEVELARIWTRVDKIRAKQAAKPPHSPLPAYPASPQQAAPKVVEVEMLTDVEISLARSAAAALQADMTHDEVVQRAIINKAIAAGAAVRLKGE